MKKLATALALATFALTGTACDQYLFAAHGSNNVQVAPPSSCDDDGEGERPLCSPPQSPSGFFTAE